MQYPGDTADPKDVAKYFAHVAESYDLPGVLPVMASCVELTAAWTGPGDVKTVRGYLEPVDHWSVGYFQQQYDDNPEGKKFGWGRKRELIQAPFALKRFCEEAAKLIDWEWHPHTTNPATLGRWCQAVQRSAVPDAYRDKGYPLAVELLAGEEALVLEYDADGWAMLDGIYVKGTAPEQKHYTNKNNWLWTPVTEIAVPDDFEWPEANDDPIPSSAWYVERHPTRYSFRPDVERLAKYYIQNYDVWCNTYYEHPPGWGWALASTDASGTKWYNENVSVDFWHSYGRGYAIDYALGQEIWSLLFNDPNKPDINWIIWQGWMWSYYGGWSWFSNDRSGADFGHFKHIHVTYF